MITTTSEERTVTVSQADRDAAAAYVSANFSSPTMGKATTKGMAFSGLAEAFARRCHEAVRVERERCAGLVDHRLAMLHKLAPAAAGAVLVALPDAIRMPSLDSVERREG